MKKRGYESEFQFRDGKLRDLDTGITYGQQDLKVVEFHRFEGQTNPSDMSIVYALESQSGCKGMVVSSFGPYAEPDMVEFMRAVPMQDRS